ncbi:macoilin-like [Styela clava]
MKRRNVEAGKPRRTFKRANKFTEGVYGSSFIYLKLILIWSLVLLADFILEFRFEYLWPFWLLIRSVCDSFKYQGLALSVLFVCVAVASDTICFLFIPVQWLFFMASTYVWVQYIWHTDRGICLPTVSLWLLFMYIEASIRLKDLRNNPFQVDLCRPFAAHCIGYPVVTLGFGFKSYIQYRLRIRTQKNVQKDNEFYFELLKNALPVEQRQRSIKQDSESSPISNGVVSLPSNGSTNSLKKEKRPNSLVDSNASGNRNIQSSFNEDSPTSASKCNSNFNNASGGGNQNSSASKKLPQQRNNNLLSSNGSKSPTPSSGGDFISSKMELRKRNTNISQSQSQSNLNSSNFYCKGPTPCTPNKNQSSSRSSSVSSLESNNSPKTHHDRNGSIQNSVMEIPQTDVKIVTQPVVDSKPSVITIADKEITKDQNILRIEELESCISDLKTELSLTRQCEGDLRTQNYTLIHGEKSAKNELSQLRRNNDELQNKLHNLVNNKQKDKQTLQSLEKRLKAETEVRHAVEKVLIEERNKRKEEEETAARAVALVASNREREEAELNKRKFQEKEKDFQNLKKLLEEKEDYCKRLHREIGELKQNEKSAKESDTLMSALAAMQEKNMMLEKSLSAETRLKLDLFSALGDVKRQYEIEQSVRMQREVEIRELKSRVAEVLSVLPESQMRSSTPHYSANFLEKQVPPTVQLSPTQHYSARFCSVPVAPISPPNMEPPHPIPIHTNPMIPQPQGLIQQMPLDPNAAIYTPPSSAV